MTPQDAQPSDRGPIPPDADDDDLTDDAVERMLQAGAGAGTMQAKWQLPPPEAIERLLPDYEIHEMIGFGGMGVVYRGVQRCLERVVAIKILAPEIARSDPQFVARFKNEARAMARLPHPRVVAVHDFSEAVPPVGDSDAPGGLLYIVMEFIDGTDLARVMAAEGRIPFPRAAVIAAQVCEALEFSHRHGIIHRDVKPSNVLIDREGGVKVADFGLAKETAREGRALTSSKIVMGTRRYMSPEQAKGGAIDHRTDIYSTGAMLYEMLTGETPHGAFEPPSHHVQLDAHVDEVVLRALARDPARRYQSAAEFRMDVMRLMAERNAEPSSRRMPSGLIALLLTGVVAAIGGAAFFRRTMTPGPPVATAASDSADFQRVSARLALDAGAQITVRMDDGVERTVLPGGELTPTSFRLVSVRFDKPRPDPPPLSSTAIVNICRATDLEVLSLYQTKPEFSDATFAAIGALRHLRELNANSPSLKDEWLRHLSGSTTLSLLRFPGSAITDAGLAHLSRISTLTDVDLSKARVTGAGLAKLSCGESLIRLTFGDASRPLTRDDMAAVAGHFPKLERFAITGPVDGEALRVLKPLKLLRTFVFTNGQRLTAAHFRGLEDSTAGHILIINASVDEDAWEPLAALKQVDTVQFTNMRWPPACERALAHMASLRTVILADGPAEDVTRASEALPHVLVQKTGYDPKTRNQPPSTASSQSQADQPPIIEMTPVRRAMWDARVKEHSVWRARKKADSAVPAPPPLSADDQRLIAERMLTLGGRPTLKLQDGRLISRTPGQTLPEGEWTVTLLDFEMPVRDKPPLPKEELMFMLELQENEGLVTYSVQPEIDDEVMAKLGTHRGLRWLGLDGVKLTDDWLRHLSACTLLESFCAIRSGISDAGLAHISHLPNLTHLNVPHTTVSGEAIARADFAPGLKYVVWGDRGIDAGPGMRAIIRACPSLIEINPSGDFTADDLSELATLRNLQTLIINLSNVSAPVINALAALGKPPNLKLVNCHIDNAAWQSMKDMRHLHTLSYIGDGWPPAATAALRSLRSLQRLELLDKSRVLLPQVRAALPGLTVVTN